MSLKDPVLVPKGPIIEACYRFHTPQNLVDEYNEALYIWNQDKHTIIELDPEDRKLIERTVWFIQKELCRRKLTYIVDDRGHYFLTDKDGKVLTSSKKHDR